MVRILLLLVVGLLVSSGKILAQDIVLPQEKAALLSFLKIQGEVPGLGYQVVYPENALDSLKVKSFAFPLNATDSGWVSGVLEDFDLLENAAVDSIAPQIYFSVFSQVSSDSATIEYLANLIRHGDFEPKTEKSKYQEDLVSFAIQTPYVPILGNRYTFVADLKLLIVILIISVFTVFSAGMFIFMLIVKSKKSKKEQLEKEYNNTIVDPLTSLLFEKDMEEISSMSQSDFEPFFPRELVLKPIYREVLIDNIISLNKKMKGEFKDKLKLLYHKLRLDEVSVSKIKLSQWHIVADGLVEINEMDLAQYLPEVKKLTNSSNFQVRSLAVAAMLNLSEKSDLSFLRDQTYPLSEWQQMNYLRIIKFKAAQKPMKIEMLFESANKSIRIFGVKLVRMLGRVDLLENLSVIADKLSDEAKIEILKTYQELGAHMEVGFINSCLLSKNKLLLAQAVKTARVLGDEESVQLLSQLALWESDFKTKLSIFRSIHELDPQKFEELMEQNPASPYLEIKNHILDPNLAHV